MRLRIISRLSMNSLFIRTVRRNITVTAVNSVLANPGIDPSHIYAEPPLLIQRGKLTYDQCMVNIVIFSSLAEDTLKQLEGRICWGCKSSEHHFFQCPSKNDPMVQARGVAGYHALLAVPPERKRKAFIYNNSRETAPASSPNSTP